MLLGRAGCLFVTFLLYGPGVLGQEETKSCVLKGSNTGSPPLQVTDLEVNVTDSMLGEKRFVTLTCNTTCSLTDNPLYIWYKSGEVVHQDSDPWYQYPVTSENTGSNYSCAVKGHGALRSPAVSVDSISQNCLKVTYAGGRYCPENPSTDETCSITYPRDLQVKVSSTQEERTELTCSTSCDLTGNPTATYTWYKNKDPQMETSSRLPVLSPTSDSYSCSVAGREERSPSVCVKDQNCWSVNYITKRICAVTGSSANMSCSYTYPTDHHLEKTFWYTTWLRNEPPDDLNLDGGRLKYYNSTENLHTLRVTGLEERDSAEYKFRFTTNISNGKYAGIPGVNLHVTGLQVKVTPSTVAEGQSVTLTCSTTCFLPGDLTYIWYKNRQLLTQVEAHQKNLYINQVSSEDHGSSYSCAIKGHDDVTSPNKTLTVRYAAKKPSVSVSPSGDIVEGSSVTLTCNSDANPPVDTYTWYKENTPSIISSGQNYTLSNFSSEDNGYYLCEARNEVGPTNSSSRLITLEGKFTLAKILLIAGFTVFVLILLLIAISLFLKKRNCKSSDDPGNSGRNQQAPANLSSVPTVPTTAQDAQTDHQDTSIQDASVHYASINFTQPKTQEEPTYSTVQKRQPQEEEVQYASVNFNCPSAAPSVKTEDPSVLYSNLRQGL